VIAIAAAALVVIAIAAASRRRRLALLLVPLGAAVVVIAIAVDSPTGLRTGQAGVAYQGAKAVLLEGYGAEIVAACVLGLSGLLLAVHAPAAARRRAPSRVRRPPRTAPERRIPRADPRKASG
jgi:hypothetical protein